MDVKESIINKKRYFDALNYLSAILDFLISPDIEKKMIFSLGGYTKGTIAYVTYVKSLPFNDLFYPRKLDTLSTMLSSVYYYESEKGFSKSQRWIDFIDYTNTMNLLFKEAVQRYKATTPNIIQENKTIISSENMHKKLQLKMIDNLCDILVALASPDIEEEITDNISCFVTVSVGSDIDCLIGSYANKTYSIIDDETLKTLHQLRRNVRQQYNYDYEKGFSKTERWINFIENVNRTNVLLEEVIQRYKASHESS